VRKTFAAICTYRVVSGLVLTPRNTGRGRRRSSPRSVPEHSRAPLRTAAEGETLFATTGKLPGVAGRRARMWAFQVLAGLVTGSSWLRYRSALELGNASRVTPVDKRNVFIVALIGAGVVLVAPE
jgi:hypothetical protein